ncbi:MAG: hypothetical protein D8M59_15835 [Planctomycetes bacterium]|nr:hypothetical protein [Planctomycetota bacterium]NOG52731.1 hypothetical protein [Planctomycetota bacterium]
MTAIQRLTDALIDYAGLFPPAGLEMDQAVALYAKHRASPHARILSHFICPAVRLEEFEFHARRLLSPEDPWPLSVLIGHDIQLGLSAIHQFLKQHDDRVTIDVLEARVDTAAQIDEAINHLPESCTVYFEFPLTHDFRGYITALAGTGQGAKIRTGGLTPSLFPSAVVTANFINLCHQADVPFKATAGLHHPVRHRNDTIGCLEHGFFNVFLGAVMLHTHHLDESDLVRIIRLTDATAFAFDGDRVTVSDTWTADADQIASAREWAVSYGSCSFDEPIEDLQGLRLL